MATGIDFMAINRGREAALSDNYRDILRIQQQEQYGLKREDQLYDMGQKRANRDATGYLSTLQTNLQRLADAGRDPVDALIAQRAAILNDPVFQGKSPETQSAIIEGLRQNAALQSELLLKANNQEGLAKITGAFGITNPVNPLGIAISTGNPLLVVEAINAKAPGTATISPDGKFVIDATGAKVPINQYVAYVSAAQSAAAGPSAAYAAQQQQRTTTAAEELKQQQDMYQAQLMLKTGSTLADVKSIYPDLVFPGDTGVSPFVATAATPEQMAALSTPMLPGVDAGAPAVSAAPVSAAPVEAGAIQQLATLVQQANAPQLDSSLAAIQKKIAEAQTELQRLGPLETQLNQLMQAERLKPDSVEKISNVQAIQQKLNEVAAQQQAITQNMQGVAGIARQITARRRALALPEVGAAPVSDFLTELRGALSQ